MLCTIWYQTLKNDVHMDGQNTVLTGWNAFEWLNQESASLNPIAWHSNFYTTFNHSHGMHMTLEWHANGISGRNSNCPIRKVLHRNCHINFLALKADDEIRLEEEYLH